ncbi:hypothetical protein [Roseateles amylovorans]|uniref:Uncharacterized protein n=1 Tax=Roseateles amylovorans TaxID=2978473 RepID=A0ABY6AWB3_9BURK|nr:hypothetical protein [Roseateles amylovorans]UXH77167.1 hypothetical protein N4261_19425 [Roseateles amylovorans]
MLHTSPIKIVAGIASVILAVTGLYLACQMRQGAVDILSVTRLRLPFTATQTARPAEVAAKPAGVRVIPIGVAATPSSGNAGRANGG